MRTFWVLQDNGYLHANKWYKVRANTIRGAMWRMARYNGDSYKKIDGYTYTVEGTGIEFKVRERIYTLAKHDDGFIMSSLQPMTHTQAITFRSKQMNPNYWKLVECEPFRFVTV